jgi:hypothetical protein
MNDENRNNISKAAEIGLGKTTIAAYCFQKRRRRKYSDTSSSAILLFVKLWRIFFSECFLDLT